MTPEAPAGPARTERVLLFRLGGGRFAIRLAEAQEVLRLGREPVPVPGAPPWLAGILNHHGRVLPLLRLDGVLGVSPPGSEQAIRVEVGGEPAALLVDGVDSLEDVRPEGPKHLGRQRAWHGDRLFELIDVADLLSGLGV